MKKKILILALIVICILFTFITGCAAYQTSNNTNNISTTTVSAKADEKQIKVEEKIRFEEIIIDYNTYYMSVYRETTTDVMYVAYDRGYGGGLTVMLNPETGKPLTYSDWVKNYK